MSASLVFSICHVVDGILQAINRGKIREKNSFVHCTTRATSHFPDLPFQLRGPGFLNLHGAM